MIKCEIIKNDEYANYLLKDKDDKEYEVNINFIDIEKPKKGTVLYIEKSLLEENVSLNFGLINNEIVSDEKEIIIIMNGQNKVYLKRYYG